MTKLFWQLWKTTPAVIGASILVAQAPIVAQTIEESNFPPAIPSAETGSSNSQLLDLIDQYGEIEALDALETPDDEKDPMAQVNSAFQLRDVDPNHWAFEAIRNLIERYQCVSGFEDRTFRGELRLNRYQFAAALNKCITSIERLIQDRLLTGDERGDGVGIGLDPGQLRQIQRLVDEFEAELAVLDAQVDEGERRVEVLEDQQFSTTTKLKASVLFTAAGAFGERQAVASGSPAIGANLDDNLTFSDRVRLNFQTSFTGKDLLRTRLQAGSFVNLSSATGTEMARLGHDAGGGNNVELDDLWYRFPVGDKTRIHVGANGLDIDNVLNVLNPYLASSDTGALSRFGRRNPLVYRGSEGAGVGVNYKIDDKFKVSALYLADDGLASDPGESSGFFSGGYSAGLQLDYAPTEDIDLAFTYLHSYQPDGEVNISGSAGSQFAKRPFTNVATSSDRFGIAGNWKASERVNIGGWFGLASANLDGQITDAPKDPSATIINWSINVAFPDLGGEGNVGGLIFGMPPKVTANDASSREDQDTSFLIEALYKYKVNKNIYVTPGFYVLLNPEHNENNDTIVVGAVRTTFKF